VVWHVVFYLTLALPAALAVFSRDLAGSPQLVAGLSLAQGAWYGLVMVWLVPGFSGSKQTVWTLVYLAVAIALWVPLAHSYPAYYMTASSFYGLMWGTLPFGWAVVGNLFLTGVIIWLRGLVAPGPISWSWEMVFYGAGYIWLVDPPGSLDAFGYAGKFKTQKPDYTTGDCST
jgi:hypothetical protein